MFNNATVTEIGLILGLLGTIAAIVVVTIVSGLDALPATHLPEALGLLIAAIAGTAVPRGAQK